jgi:hypothetical protein
MIGHTYKDLEILALASQKRKPWKKEYFCKCTNCYNFTRSRHDGIRNGNSASCGVCRVPEIAKKRGLRRIRLGTAVRQLVLRYQHSARKKGQTWALSVAQARDLYFGNCAYCGQEPKQQRTTIRGEVVTYNGIDRVDPMKGYEIGNVVSCCWPCNDDKSALPYATWEARRAQRGRFWACQNGWTEPPNPGVTTSTGPDSLLFEYNSP